ncbi:MAG: glycerol-3-phosphate 1-O-acyltransferase PlsY [Candidatus Sericytochromatia bacterium]|nr:glycerol-3-phosphate 1-O-acyltransferase PlsY [Candidatus Tanganyikabacteria bacterium]
MGSLVIAAFVASYLVGAIPFSYLIPKLLYGVDIRTVGSGNVGATNVARVLGKGPGFACFLLDVAKGAGPVAALQFVPGVPLWAPVLGAAAAILGHSKSVFLRFGGGKAVATGVGTILALNPLVGLACLALWGGVFAATRVVSVASITAALALPGLMIAIPRAPAWSPNPDAFVYYSMAAGAFIIFRHKANICRIMDGTEPRFGAPAPGPEAATGPEMGPPSVPAPERDAR